MTSAMSRVHSSPACRDIMQDIRAFRFLIESPLDRVYRAANAADTIQ